MYNIVVYSPVIIVLSLIIIVYGTYLGGYIYVLMAYNNTQIADKIFPAYTKRESIKGSYRKGLTLLILTLYFLLMFIISFLRTVVMDPGYFESPIKVEKKLLDKISPIQRENQKSNDSMIQISKQLSKEIKELDDELTIDLIDKNFSSLLNEKVKNGPTTEIEYLQYRHFVSRFYNNEKKINEERLMYLAKSKKHVTKDSKIENDDLDDAALEEEEKTIHPTNMDDIWANFKDTNLMTITLCSSCHRLKVERSHHCRQCGRCLLKMDHHCPWVANCIGFRNYKYFCLIHLNGIILTLIVTLTFWEVVVGSLLSVTSSFGECFIFLFAYVINVGLMGFLIWLFASNFKLVFTAQTVIEQSDRERFPSAKAFNVYDLGYYKNFTTVFGTNPLIWFVPFYANYAGDGIVFEKNQNHIEKPSIKQNKSSTIISNKLEENVNIIKVKE